MEEMVAISVEALETVKGFLKNTKLVLMDPRTRVILQIILEGEDCPAKEALRMMVHDGD